MIGIKVPGKFVPGTVDGIVTEAQWVKGTYVVVNTVDEANLIPMGARVDGTLVYVLETDTEYRWNSGDWEVIPKAFEDAPKDGKIYARQNGVWTEIKVDEIENDINTIKQELVTIQNSIPTQLSDLSDWQSFLEHLDTLLSNYVPKSELSKYTQMVLGPLPETGEPNILYIVQLQDTYELNIWWNDVVGFVSIGSSSGVDLSNYYTKEETENLVHEVENKIPTTTNQLTNDSGFITKSIDDLDNYYTSTTVDGLLADKADNSDIPDVSNLVTNNELVQSLESKQDILVSGTTIKTINGQDIMGSGNLEVEASEVSSNAVSNALDELYGQSSTGDNTLILDGNS